MNVLLDTNVILDFFLLREPGISEATKIFELVYREKIEAFTTSNSITDIYYITAKRLGDTPARDMLKNLLSILSVISVNGADCITALDLLIPDFEDALVAVCAKKVEIDYIITNDKRFLCIDPRLANVISAEAFTEIR
ncbi:MAG: PIN domain-containing protein [Gracilibacteraceae bacterium]|jgi:predicted nucleic acid-binding protein|nr:PIN domain-containing protein [Gracilibacteraceae bacterium]